MSSKTLSAILLALGLSACASLPPPDTGAAGSAGTLSLVTQSRTLHLASRPGFSPARYDGLAVGRIDIRRPAQLDDQDQAGYETLRAALAEQLAKTSAAPGTSGTPAAPAKNALRMDVALYDVQPVSPALNVLSAAALFLPLDTGAVTLEATFTDADGTVQARRTERLSGDVTSILSGFSRYERLKEALIDWAARCGSWDKQACATAASGS